MFLTQSDASYPPHYVLCLDPFFFFLINCYLIDLINHEAYPFPCIIGSYHWKWKIPNITDLQPLAPRVWALLLKLCHMCICFFYVPTLLQSLQAPLELELLTTLVKLLQLLIFGPSGLHGVTNCGKCANRARTDWLWTRWSEYAPLMHGRRGFFPCDGRVLYCWPARGLADSVTLDWKIQ